jgi:hypothetical protein
MATLSALVSGLDAELRRLGYKDSTLVWYRGCWRRLERFFAARRVEEFCLDVAIAWVDEACGFFEKERAGTLPRETVRGGSPTPSAGPGRWPGCRTGRRSRCDPPAASAHTRPPPARHQYEQWSTDGRPGRGLWDRCVIYGSGIGWHPTA